jgi:hypothetical protein
MLTDVLTDVLTEGAKDGVLRDGFVGDLGLPAVGVTDIRWLDSGNAAAPVPNGSVAAAFEGEPFGVPADDANLYDAKGSNSKSSSVLSP